MNTKYWKQILVTTTLSLIFFLHGTNNARADQEKATIVLHSRTINTTEAIDMDLAGQLAGRSTPWHGLITFETNPTAERRQALAASGITLWSYIPNNTWLATLPADLNSITSQPDVRWVGRYEAADKVAPHLANNSAAWAISADNITLVATLFADADVSEVTADVVGLGGTTGDYDAANGRLAITVPLTDLNALAGVDAIQWLAASEPPKSSNNHFIRPAVGVDAIQSGNYDLDGSGVVAAMWEDGHPDATHPDFAGRLTLVGAYPVRPHATHVLGTMGGDGTNTVQYNPTPFKFRGMAPGVQMLAYNWSNVVNAHDDAINNRDADLSQNSWGYAVCSLAGQYDFNAPEYDDIINGLFGRGIPVIFAAGNMQTSCGGDGYGSMMGGPSSAKNVISVGATFANDDSMTSFSSWGPTSDGRLKPEIVAPGAKTTGTGGIWSTIPGGGYGAYIGTSQAAPVVSGAIALMLERYSEICPQGGDLAGNPLPSTTRALLIHSATDLVDGGAMMVGPDYASGYGLLNIKAAVNMLPNHIEDSITDGSVREYTLSIARQPSLKVTLAWDDVAGTPAAAIALVNDLDLELVDPNGAIFYPWSLDPFNPSAPATTGVDDLNVVEQVSIENPTAGEWTVRVRGTSVPQGPQSYSLASEQLKSSSCNSFSTQVWLEDSSAANAPIGQTPSSPPPWDSTDIWVRQQEDINLQYAHQHQAPEYGQTNYLYIKARNDGDEIAHTVQVYAYYADQSTGPATWAQDWQLIGQDTLINIPAMSADVAMIEWQPPQPADPIAGQDLSLYIRLVSVQDPMVEGSDAAANVTVNDNIAGKHVSVFESAPTAVTLTGVNTLPTRITTPLLALVVLGSLITFALLANHVSCRRAQLAYAPRQTRLKARRRID